MDRLISAVTGGILWRAVRNALMRLVRPVILVGNLPMGSLGLVVHTPRMRGTGDRGWYERE